MHTIKIIFAHGNGGSTPQDHWFPYLKTELVKLGLTVIARQFPDAHLARESYWIPFLKNELKADENTIIIGHSSGAVAAMRFAESNKLLGSILVGVCYTDLGNEYEKLSGYYDRPWNWQAIKNNQQWIALFASTDDPWIPIKEPRFICEQLEPDYYEYNNRGHFHNKKFPEIISMINLLYLC